MKKPIQVMVVGDGSFPNQVRWYAAATVIQELYSDRVNIAVDIIRQGEMNVYECDVLVVPRPLHFEVQDAYKKTYNCRVIVEMDDNFGQIHSRHPGYKAIGPQSKAYAINKLCIEHADFYTFSTQYLADSLNGHGKPYRVIPNGWQDGNYLWEVPKIEPPITIGWGGTITHRSDFQIVKSALKEVFNQRPETRLFVAGDPEIFKMFKELPWNRKTLIPAGPYTDWPVFMRQLDIGLAPLVDDEFNRNKSFIKAVEYQAAGVPCVVSNVVPYQEFAKANPTNGMILSNDDQWFGNIMFLVDDELDRRAMGKVGQAVTKKYAMSKLALKYIEAIEAAMEIPNENLVPASRSSEDRDKLIELAYTTTARSNKRKRKR